MTRVRAWLESREPAPPLELVEWLTVPDRHLPLVDHLAEAGMDALLRAEARPGRDREAAFQLLAADALLTYACEAAAEQDDVEGALSRVLDRVVNRD